MSRALPARPTRPPRAQRRGPLALVIALTATGWLCQAAAQQIYRSVDAQGRVVFTDQPSSPAAPAARPWSAPGTTPKSHPTDAAVQGPQAGQPALPLALREIAQKFPVTFYAAQHCTPCDAARQSLQARGIPYTERSVDSAQDLQAFTQLSGQPQLPFATVGRQHIVGWNHSEWHNYLTLAGYPNQSSLPASWKPAPATPLAPASAAAAAAPVPPAGAIAAPPTAALPTQPPVPGAVRP